MALYATPEIKARVIGIEAELRGNSLARAEIDREWVLRGLKENIHRASQVKPVLNRQGEPTGQYKYEPGAVNRGYELVGKELGMFVERFSMESLDATLEGMNSQELRAFMRSAAIEVGLRMLDMTDDETRVFILKHAPRVGLKATPAPVH